MQDLQKTEYTFIATKEFIYYHMWYDLSCGINKNILEKDFGLCMTAWDFRTNFKLDEKLCKRVISIRPSKNHSLEDFKLIKDIFYIYGLRDRDSYIQYN